MPEKNKEPVSTEAYNLAPLPKGREVNAPLFATLPSRLFPINHVQQDRHFEPLGL